VRHRLTILIVLTLLILGLSPAEAQLQSGMPSDPGDGEAPEIAIVWEDEHGVICSWEPPEPLENGFTFNVGNRWFDTATDPSGLGQGDPMTLTWGIVPDGTNIPGFNGEPTAGSDLIAFLDTVIGAGPGGSDLTQRPWFASFQAIFDTWATLTGIRYVYEPNDDGVTFSSNPFVNAGQLGTRPDIRIGGHSIDGQSGSNVLAYNFFPDVGDMVIDTDNSGFFGSSFGNFLGLRNTLAHEHGHGLGIDHVCPISQTKLMEPFVSFAFDGAQEDDILAANRGYGDTLEFPGENDTAGTASSLGSPAIPSTTAVNGVSIDDNSDVDFFAVTVPAGTRATVTLTPTGTTYLSGPQNANGSCSAGSNFNAKNQSNLALELRGLSGNNVLASANAGGLGATETITNFALPEGAGTYFVRVSGSANAAQMYSLSVQLDATEADLSITKTESADPAYTGTSLVYTIEVSNAGPLAATNVVVTETLPGAVTFVSTSGCNNDPGGVATCNLGTINAGASKSFTVKVTVDHGASGTATNQVAVASDVDDPVAGNNTASVGTSIQTVPCVANLTLDAGDVNAADAWQASGTITAQGTFNVPAADSVRLMAGSSITLQNGFSVGAGATFTAVVDPLISCPP
jgi:uncharacterized repeat protein (TIGR01451 family)